MASPCYYHPTVSSAGTCIQCGMPACTGCLEQVGGKSVCQKCAAPFKTRLAQQAAAAPLPSALSPSVPMPTAYGTGSPAAAEASDRKELLIGITLALVIGLIGAVLIEKILFYAHFGLSLLYVGLGYGIGWGIHRATGRGGAGLALAAVGIMTVCLCVSHLVWSQDVLNMVRDAGRADASATLFDAFPVAMSHLGVMHWVCVVFGLLACYRGVEQQQ